MRIHCLQHVPFEEAEEIAGWAEVKGHELTTTRLYENQALPAIRDFDMLVVMGGPMGVYDEALYSWMTAEKSFIKDAIHSHKLTLGICLGAQLIAEQIGGEVYPNKWKEIGWFPVRLTGDAQTSAFSKDSRSNGCRFTGMEIPSACLPERGGLLPAWAVPISVLNMRIM